MRPNRRLRLVTQVLPEFADWGAVVQSPEVENVRRSLRVYSSRMGVIPILIEPPVIIDVFPLRSRYLVYWLAGI